VTGRNLLPKDDAEQPLLNALEQQMRPKSLRRRSWHTRIPSLCKGMEASSEAFPAFYICDSSFIDEKRFYQSFL